MSAEGNQEQCRERSTMSEMPDKESSTLHLALSQQGAIRLISQKKKEKKEGIVQQQTSS